MIKKVLLFFVLIFMISCGTKKHVVQTTKPSKPVVRVVKPITKPVTNPTPTPTQPTEPKVVDNNQKIEILEATTRVKVTKQMVLDYIEKYKKIAKDDMVQYGIPASIILGQGILESGAGTGPLSTQANNHFGIKCKTEWTGQSVRYNDDEENECFRKYNDPSESYKDHSLFLTTRDRYFPLFDLDKDDYKGWAKGLKNAGYATDPSYPTKLIALIERYELPKIDAEVLGKDYVSPIHKPNTISNPVANNVATVETHEVIKGETLYSISKKYNIAIDDIIKKNNIVNNTISIGQNLIIK